MKFREVQPPWKTNSRQQIPVEKLVEKCSALYKAMFII
jgi:hypothetical protein